MVAAMVTRVDPPLALLKHLAGVERRWFQWGFAGERVGDPNFDRGPDHRFRLDPVVRELADGTVGE
jgi:Protein of unknown function (DUF664)